MREESAAELRRRSVAQAQRDCRDHEIAQLKSMLQGMTATSAASLSS